MTDLKDVIIKRVNATTVYVDTDRGFLRTVGEHYTFFPDNYMWSRAYKNKLWDGKIRLFNVNTGSLPAGLLTDLVSFCKENGKSYELIGFTKVIDRKTLEADFDRFFESLTLPEKFREIRPYQRKAVIDILENNHRGIIISPTGSGKSFITYLLLRYHLSRGLVNGQTVIIVPTINLVTQLYKDFQNFAQYEKKFNVEEMFHLIYDGAPKETDKKFSISTWQSLQYIKDSKYFRRFGMVVTDEVHTAEADVLPKIIEKCINADIKIGLTGTLKESNIKPLQLVGLFGTIVKTRTTRELMDDGYLPDVPMLAMVAEYSEPSKKEFWAHIKEAMKDAEGDSVGAKKYAAELNFLRNFKPRNTLIIRLLQKWKGDNNLVLFRSVEHAKMMETVLTKMGFEVLWMKRELSKEQREEMRQYIENNNGLVILSTYQIFQLGISINNLDNVIFGAPSKGRIRVLQSFGRILRKSETGKIGFFVDIIDDIRSTQDNITYAHGVARLQYYREDKIKVIYKKVIL